MNEVIAASSALGAGLVLLLVAGRRGWQPSLRTALAAGAVLRGVVWIVAASQTWQPKDFRLDFPAAAVAVLHHHDPVLSGRPRGWPFLPTMAFVFAAEFKAGQLAHVPWPVIGRAASVAADMVLIPLVGKLAPERGRLRSFQYACNPLSVLVCALHGQLEPEILALGVAAFLAARSRRGGAAGILLGLSASIGSWSLLLLPGVLLTLPSRAQRVRAVCWMAGVPAALLLTSPITVGTPVGRLPDVAHRIAGLRSLVGNWGWPVAVTRGRLELLTQVGRIGVVALAIALALAGYLWRRAHPVDLTSALLITFLVVSPRVSVQYLAWPVPFLIARTTQFTGPAIAAASVWDGFGYLGIGPHRTPAWVHGSMWYLTSWDVIPLLVAAMPWERRGGAVREAMRPAGAAKPAAAKPGAVPLGAIPPARLSPDPAAVGTAPPGAGGPGAGRPGTGAVGTGPPDQVPPAAAG